MDDSLLTPYGPPSPYAYIIPVPNECIGLIIGKGGETIRLLQQKSGAKIQVAKKELPNSDQRYVFVEATEDKYQLAKNLIEEIVDEHKRNQSGFTHIGEQNPYEGPKQVVPIPNNLTGLLIGKNGDTLK